MKKLIYLEDAIDAICKKCKADYPDTTACDICDDISILKSLPSAQPEEDWTEITVICDNCGHAVHAKREDCRVSAEPEQRWSRLMMHLADLQLTYSPNWGADGQGDQKLYDFVTGLIEELEGWEDKLPTEPEQRWIPCSERLPEEAYPVIVTWKNDDPASYYQYILGKHYVGVAHYKNDKWFWYSSVTEDTLMEYGRCDSEEFDEAIKVLAWMPLPEPAKLEDD